MRVFFLSDLHLSSGSAEPALKFERFLRAVPKKGDIVVLGGDIFDLFVGDKRVFQEKFNAILRAMKDLSANGCRLYYLEGNHDFYLNGVFAASPGIELKETDFFFEAMGRKFWVSHGDLIDPEDRGYRLLRACFRSRPFRLLVDSLPGALIDGIGRRSSKKSRKYTNSEKIDGENQQRLRGLYLRFAEKKVEEGFHHVLVGHSHLRDQVTIQKPGILGEYVNLGFSGEDLYYGELKQEADHFDIKVFQG